MYGYSRKIRRTTTHYLSYLIGGYIRIVILVLFCKNRKCFIQIVFGYLVLIPKEPYKHLSITSSALCLYIVKQFYTSRLCRIVAPQHALAELIMRNKLLFGTFDKRLPLVFLVASPHVSGDTFFTAPIIGNMGGYVNIHLLYIRGDPIYKILSVVLVGYIYAV